MQSLDYAHRATDADGNTLTYSAIGLPDGLTIDTASGAISGTLTTAGVFSVTVSASDGTDSGQASFSWHVTTPPPVNRDPVVTAIPDQSHTVGDTVAVYATVFKDGHETLAGALRVRGPGERRWRE